MARVLFLVVAAVCVVMAMGKCHKHCPHPNGPFGKYLCCDEHYGRCPTVRKHCPATQFSSTPTKCFFDPECGLNEKCCKDVCIKDSKVCKLAL